MTGVNTIDKSALMKLEQMINNLGLGIPGNLNVYRGTRALILRFNGEQ